MSILNFNLIQQNDLLEIKVIFLYLWVICIINNRT